MNNLDTEYTSWEQEVISLAAIAQAATVVNKLAVRGEVTQLDISACINPLLVLNPRSFNDVFGNIAELIPGLRSLEAIFANQRENENPEVMRYFLSLLHLRNNLIKDADMQEVIRDRLQLVSPMRAIYSVDDQVASEVKEQQRETFQQLASLYQDTISTLSYRIQVQGRTDYLKDEQIANQIRAALLSGIRSAVLWYQVGGRRWRLFVYRKRIKSTAENLRKGLLS